MRKTIRVDKEENYHDNIICNFRTTVITKYMQFFQVNNKNMLAYFTTIIFTNISNS
jgi:hypothetical protein